AIGSPVIGDVKLHMYDNNPLGADGAPPPKVDLYAKAPYMGVKLPGQGPVPPPTPPQATATPAAATPPTGQSPPPSAAPPPLATAESDVLTFSEPEPPPVQPK